MAHIRKNCSKPSQTVSFEPTVYKIARTYWHEEDKDNFSQCVNELIMMGYKYKKLVEKKKAARMLG